MTKREALHHWLEKQGDWVYLNEVPFAQLGMSRAACSSSLIALCQHGCADFRIVGIKQYRATSVPLPPQGRPRSKGGQHDHLPQKTPA